MYSFAINKQVSYHDLPLSQLNKLNHSIYLITFEWNYIFVNDFVRKNLGERAEGIEGKNMWEVFIPLQHDQSFMQMKKDCEAGMESEFISTSPLTGQRLHVKTYIIKDCFFISSNILPDKGELIKELRNELQKTPKEKKNR